MKLDAPKSGWRDGEGRDLASRVLAAYCSIADRIVHTLDKVAGSRTSTSTVSINRTSQAVTGGTAIIPNLAEYVLPPDDRFPGSVLGHPGHASIPLIPGGSLIVGPREEIAVLRIAPHIADRRLELSK